jgi:hypothetical protein
MKKIRQLMKTGAISQGEPLQAFKRRMPEEHKALLDRVERKAFDDVIPRFHIVRDTPVVTPIFSFTGRPGKVGDTIELTDGGRHFLVENKRLVDYIAISGWVRFTEQFTSAPRLHDKIENNKKRASVSQYRDPLKIIQGARCFYDASHDMSLSEVDHVLPWSFVLEDKIWNLVLACRKCNNEKRDRLANVAALERLCSRNAEIAKGYEGIETAFFRHFSEWHSRDLSSHIRGLYDQAVADGFPEWK